MASLSTLHGDLAPLALQFLQIVRESYPDATITSAYRSSAKQAALYRRWQSGRSPFPAAPPGQSLHEYRLAFDMDIPSDRSALADAGALWESIGPGFRWGGRFSRADPVHFEYRPS
ncbi:MAG: M15 family metallopeptidase [Candidatus Rokuibacteriota bacterium]